jgi:SAM-dependent MidA family methyltransferase
MSWMVDEITDRGGEVTFRDFMELALYHHQHGYYSAESPRYGRHGDFLTAPTASEWYAVVLGRCFRLLAEQLGPLVLVDLAAGDGSFAGHLITGLGAEAPATIERMILVERSPARQQQLLSGPLRKGRVPVAVVAALDQATCPDRFTILHASELYDALPIHRVVQRETALHEHWVRVEKGTLTWCERVAPALVVSYFRAHGVELQVGQIAEANLAAQSLHASILQWVAGEGMAIVLDYGYPAARLYNPRGRFTGSLACYRKHRLSRDPLACPGEQDITAHVCWNDLQAAAATTGWHEVALVPLAELLVRGGLEAEMARRGFGIEAELDTATIAARQEIKRLLDPEGMGADLKALVQATPDATSTVAKLLGL